jgi:cobalt-zinc-cadmium efflux system outer membrane protein
MKGQLHLCVLVLVYLNATVFAAVASERWRSPLAEELSSPPDDSTITLSEALGLVSRQNPALQALTYDTLSARHLIEQAGLYPNPELEAEMEDILLDAPGLKKPEITLQIAQELALFGRRGARQALAQADLESANWDATAEAFDLYLETKLRFYGLVHAQGYNELLAGQAELAQEIVENIEFRINKGAGLESESLLARLELNRIELELSEARQDLRVAQSSLASLWGGATDPIVAVAETEPDLTRILEFVERTPLNVDSTRGLLALSRKASRLQAEQELAAAEARPSLTLRGGFRRVEAEGTNSLLVGLSMPLPLWDRNQGEQKSIQARQQALELDRREARIRMQTDIDAAMIRLRQLHERHQIIHRELLPTADSVYLALEEDYEAGRLPFTSLLEAERALLQLRREHADLLLEIQLRLTALERVTGLVLTTQPLRGYEQ